MPAISIVIPTFNEKENIRTIITRVLEVIKKGNIDAELLIIDDNSPDGTAALATSMARKHPEIRVEVRKNERGLSSAVLRGFKLARGDIFLVMDADLSHPPELIPKLLAPIIARKCQIAMASRYIKGGGTEGWPASRTAVSKGATFLAKLVTSVKDPMSGFFALRSSVISDVDLNPKGYKIALEILARGNYKTVIEVPFIFKDRAAGKSKLSRKVMGQYVQHLAGLLFAQNSIFKQFVKFCVVGLIGTLFNLAVLFAIVEWAHLWYLFGATIAFCVAVTSNYTLNKYWTFQDTSKRTERIVGRYLKFIVVSLPGLALNLAILYILTEFTHIWYLLSQVIAIVAASVLNYLGSRAVVFTSAR